MKKTLFTAFLIGFAAMALCSAAFADVAAAPMYIMFFGIPALCIGVAIVALALVIRAIIKRNREKDDRENGGGSR